MIRMAQYKDRPAVIVESAAFRATFLPEDGAKLASYVNRRGEELLVQAPGETYLRMGLTDSYVGSECSAFDDMFPTIDPCVIGGREYLDHGEVCRRAHRVTVDGEAVTFTCELPGLNVTFAKTAYADGEALRIRYCMTNHNDAALPCLWAGHMMFNGEEGQYVVSDFAPDADKVVMFGAPPSDQTAHILEPYGANKGYKVYYTEKKAPIRCGLVWPATHKRVDVTFDNDVVGYLGLWVNPGDLKGMYNLALEPCTALYDDPIRAEKGNAASEIPACGVMTFTMTIENSAE